MQDKPNYPFVAALCAAVLLFVIAAVAFMIAAVKAQVALMGPWWFWLGFCPVTGLFSLINMAWPYTHEWRRLVLPLMLTTYHIVCIILI